MSEFPLYENLIKNVNTKDLKIKQKHEFIEIIKIIDENGKELIYALIRIYFEKNKKEDNMSTSVIEKTSKKGEYNITWNFNHFPNKLKQLLYNFVKMNAKKNREDKNRK